MTIAGRLRRLDAAAEARLRAWQARGVRRQVIRPTAPDRRGFRAALLAVIGITWVVNKALDVTVPWYVVVLAVFLVHASAQLRPDRD